MWKIDPLQIISSKSYINFKAHIFSKISRGAQDRIIESQSWKKTWRSNLLLKAGSLCHLIQATLLISTHINNPVRMHCAKRSELESPPTAKSCLTSALDPVLNMISWSLIRECLLILPCILFSCLGGHMYPLFDLTAPFLCTQNGNNSAQ